jgi:hypothetical protein
MSSIAAGRGFIAGQAPELKPIEKLKYKLITKSQIDIHPSELLLIVNCSRLFQRPALLAAILVCVSSEAVYEMRVGLSMGGVEQTPPSNRLDAALL